MSNENKTAQEIIDEAFPSSVNRFMEPQVTEKQKWASLDGKPGTSYIPLDVFEGPHDNSGEHFTEDGIYKPGEYEFEIIEGYGARLSAPGYLDCTEWSVFETDIEAAEYLAEQYGDADEEDEEPCAVDECNNYGTIDPEDGRGKVCEGHVGDAKLDEGPCVNDHDHGTTPCEPGQATE